MKLFGRIYFKIYLSFLLIFIVALLVVSYLTSSFYAGRVRTEVRSYFFAQARYLENQYEEDCAVPSSAECQHFLKQVDRMELLQVWILDPKGKVILSHEKSVPRVDKDDLRQATAGEMVSNVRPRTYPWVMIPVRGASKQVEKIFLLQRSFFMGGHLPRFPFILPLLLAGITIAVLVLPLSLWLTRPTRELHHMAQEWSEGHLDKRAKLSGRDEITELGDVFNTMAENLQKNLEQRKEFLALISHELKSPLARMNIALELLSEKSALSQDEIQLLKSIRMDIAESEKLVEQLLVLSRIEMNLPAPMLEEIDVNALLKRSVQQLAPLAETSGVRISNGQPGNTEKAVVQGDSSQLQRALLNVIENAIKFSPANGEVRVDINRQGGSLAINVIDQGSGIAPDESDKIFQPFYRGKTAVGKAGTGLGLFLAKRIIESHKGTISAHQNSPAGTRISIHLPEANA